MTLKIEIPDELAGELQAQAAAQGISADSYVGRVLEQKLSPVNGRGSTARKPLKSSYGILAKYGTAPSAEEMDEARREVWGDFPGE
jgi:hypothetical protein